MERRSKSTGGNQGNGIWSLMTILSPRTSPGLDRIGANLSLLEAFVAGEGWMR